MGTITRATAGNVVPTTLGTNSVGGSEFPALDGSEVKGHRVQVETKAELDAWPVVLRQWGQKAYVVNDPLVAGYVSSLSSPVEFRLDDSGDDDLSNNANWVAISSGGTTLPTGGTEGQVLVKTGSGDSDLDYSTLRTFNLVFENALL